jgi:hypothetical protein
MRYSAAFAALLATASGLSIFGGNQDVIANNDLKIPGDSPLELCQGDHKDDLVQIEKVDLEPNPPAAYVELDPPSPARLLTSHNTAAKSSSSRQRVRLKKISRKAPISNFKSNIASSDLSRREQTYVSRSRTSTWNAR